MDKARYLWRNPVAQPYDLVKCVYDLAVPFNKPFLSIPYARWSELNMHNSTVCEKIQDLSSAIKYLRIRAVVNPVP